MASSELPTSQSSAAAAGTSPRGRASASSAPSGALPSSDDARARHLSALSHDVRGHLNGLLLNIEVLKRDLAPRPGFEEQIADLDMMRRSVLDTVHYVDRLVYAERFRLGLVSPRPGRVDLSFLVSMLRSHYRLAAEERGASFSVSATGEAFLDRNLLVLCIANLVGNAVTHGTGPAVQVQIVGAGDAWALTITDGGTQVPAKVRDILAEPLDPARLVPGVPGGLGLRLVRHAAAMLGARLQPCSQEVSFTMELRRP